MDLTNKKVKHEVNGNGTISYINNNKKDNTKIIFENGKEGMYTFPDEFVDISIHLRFKRIL